MAQSVEQPTLDFGSRLELKVLGWSPVLNGESA